MSDVSFSFGMKDEVTPVIQRQKAAAQDLNKTFRDIGQSASKAGGAFGGIAGRVLGGAGGPFAGLALGATLLTTALTMANAASDAAIKRAQDRLTWEQRIANAVKSGNDARNSTAAGGLSQAAGVRILIGRGGKVSDAQDDVKRAKIGLDDAVSGEAALRLTADVKRRGQLKDQALQLAATGEVSFADAVKRLADMPGRPNLARVLTDLRGQMPTGANLHAATVTLDDFNNPGIGSAAKNETLNRVRDTIVAGQGVAMAQQNDLVSGRSRSAIEQQTAQTLNPIGKVMDDLQTEVANGAAQLKVAADAQLKVQTVMQRLGVLLGGEGTTARDKLSAYNTATAGVRNQ
jgi:hypothetical protein